MNLSNETSCEVSRYIGSTTLDYETEKVLRCLTISFILLLWPFAVFLNILLIVLIGKFKVLWQTTFFLALQVVIIDLGITVIVTPISVINAIAGQWILGPTLCAINSFFVTLTRQSRNSLMFVFVTDRFCSVFFPFRYFKYRKKVVIPLCIVAYLVTIILIIVEGTLDCNNFSRVTWHCSIGGGCANPEGCEIARATTIILTNIWGSYIPLIMYTILFIKAKMIKNKLPPAYASEEIVQNNKRERKTNLTFFFLFLSLFGVTFFPFVFYVVGRYILQALGIRPSPEYLVVVIILRTLYNILPIIDAIAIMRNPDVRRALALLKKKLRISKERSRKVTTKELEVPNSLALEHTVSRDIE